MTMQARATLRWLTKEQDGRTRLPTGPCYSTVARFEALADQWPQVAWSLVLDFHEPPTSTGSVASVRFLMPENAPHHLLYRGARFELFEGARKVAAGEVIAPAEPITDL